MGRRGALATLNRSRLTVGPLRAQIGEAKKAARTVLYRACQL